MVWTPFTHPSTCHRGINSIPCFLWNEAKSSRETPLLYQLPLPSPSQQDHMTWGFSQLICPLTWIFLPRPGVPGSFPTLGTRFSSTLLKGSGTAHWAAIFFLGFGLAPGFCLLPHPHSILYRFHSQHTVCLQTSCPVQGPRYLPIRGSVSLPDGTDAHCFLENVLCSQFLLLSHPYHWIPMDKDIVLLFVAR